MTNNHLTRRDFIFRAGTSVSAVWLAAHWPAILAAATHARHAAQSTTPPQFQFFSPEQAKEIEAITSRILPSDETPGAREAGAVYFIDHALTTFAINDQQTYKDGLPALQSRVRELFPALDKFSSASPEQQDEVLRSIDDHAPSNRRPFRPAGVHASFFETVRLHTIVAFLIDPESGGNRGGVGWKVVGRDLEHTFQPPFGYYDKDYPGWQPFPQGSEKGKP
jgi:Gluconate 2-dehydrogenase subunit 3